MLETHPAGNSWIRKVRLPPSFGLPALAGLSAAHGLVPPHPGPLAAISALTFGAFDYDHPQFDTASLAAQRRLPGHRHLPRRHICVM